MRRNEHPEDVKARVRKTGVTLSEVARRAGISVSAAHKCLYRCTPAGNRAIARHLGVKLHALWPEWFRRDGSRLLPDAENRIRSSRSGHRQKRRAA